MNDNGVSWILVAMAAWCGGGMDKWRPRSSRSGKMEAGDGAKKTEMWVPVELDNFEDGTVAVQPERHLMVCPYADGVLDGEIARHEAISEDADGDGVLGRDPQHLGIESTGRWRRLEGRSHGRGTILWRWTRPRLMQGDGDHLRVDAATGFMGFVCGMDERWRGRWVGGAEDEEWLEEEVLGGGASMGFTGSGRRQTASRDRPV